MASTSYLVFGVVYTSRGSVPNSRVEIDSDIFTITDSEGKYILDLANLQDDYTSGGSFVLQAKDKFDNEFKSEILTVSGENQEKDLFLDSRSMINDQTKNHETRRGTLRTAGNEPVSKVNLLPVESSARQLTKKLAAVSGTSKVEYIGEASPGTPTSEAKWRIQKLIYDGTFTTGIAWSKGNTEFDKSWDDRASYSYS